MNAFAILSLIASELIIFFRNYEDDFEFEDDLDEDDVIPLKDGKGIEQNLSKSLSYFTGTGSDSDSDDGGTFY